MLDKYAVYLNDVKEKQAEFEKRKDRLVHSITALGLTAQKTQMLVGQLAKTLDAAVEYGKTKGEMTEYENGILVSYD